MQFYRNLHYIGWTFFCWFSTVMEKNMRGVASWIFEFAGPTVKYVRNSILD